MWKRLTLLSTVTLTVVLSLFPAGYSGAGPAQPRRGGTLTVSVDADAATLNPFVFRFNVERNVLTNIYETFANYDLKTFDLANTGALESWQVSTNGLTYTLRLWPDMKFQDGSAATAEDAKWSLEKAAQPTSARTAAWTVERSG